ncbi:hypothetical protein QAD02_001272 [Eretmocerus hayati]|uniref:Uncharacterized protein n=1 Tax=Eretmocerus hayati TaxID=131215 RepID=A0ACC2NFS2_9HYME|nr:hypothetical protein QAD02_001272 [Eretmocerus hayati]
MLACLAKLTEIFDIPHDFHSLKKLGNDDTVVSAGALLLKLSFLVTAKSIGFKLIDPTDLDATLHDDSYMHTNENNSNSLALNSSTLMAVKGCIPNIKIDYTRELMCVWHSLQPIKKGDKFIYLDMSSTIYNYIPKSIRQSVSRLFYNCACDCQACTEDWSMFDLEMGMEAVVSKNQSMVIQMKNECDFLTAEKKCNPQKYINPDMKALCTAKDLIVRAWEHCDMPSAIITRAVRIFTETSGDFYGGSRLGSK